MEMTTLVRLVCTIAAVVLLAVIIMRRKSRESEE
jgi:hypothetical protein